MSKQRSRSLSKADIEAMREEYEALHALAQKAIRERGQTDTYWNTRAKQIKEELDALGKRGAKEESE